MRKILTFLSLALIISCSLDTFKSENLASWTINFDFPLFRKTYTIAELLKDYDELGVEYMSYQKQVPKLIPSISFSSRSSKTGESYEKV